MFIACQIRSRVCSQVPVSSVSNEDGFLLKETGHGSGWDWAHTWPAILRSQAGWAKHDTTLSHRSLGLIGKFIHNEKEVGDIITVTEFSPKCRTCSRSLVSDVPGYLTWNFSNWCLAVSGSAPNGVLDLSSVLRSLIHCIMSSTSPTYFFTWGQRNMFHFNYWCCPSDANLTFTKVG